MAYIKMLPSSTFSPKNNKVNDDIIITRIWWVGGLNWIRGKFKNKINTSKNSYYLENWCCSCSHDHDITSGFSIQNIWELKNIEQKKWFMKMSTRTFILKPALALVSMNITPSSCALASPSSIETCLLYHPIGE